MRFVCERGILLDAVTSFIVAEFISFFPLFQRWAFRTKSLDDTLLRERSTIARSLSRLRTEFDRLGVAPRESIQDAKLD
jgi:predicted transcriptional regulator